MYRIMVTNSVLKDEILWLEYKLLQVINYSLKSVSSLDH